MEPQANHHKLLVTVLILALVVGGVFYVAQKTDKSYVIHINNASGVESLRNLPIPPSSNTATLVDPGTVDVTSCVINPMTATVPLKGTLHFKNTDKVVHVISFSSKISYVIPSQGSKDIVFNFDTMPGSRRFSCDGKLGAGTVIITKAL